MDRRGRCLCGAVTYTAHDVSTDVHACHCGMCRRWTGATFIGFQAGSVEWTGEDSIGVFQSSDWAERGFCKQCGTGLFYRLTIPGHEGQTHIPFGTAEDQSGLSLVSEFFIDRKPEVFELAGERKRLTEAEAIAMFTGGG